MPRRLRALVVFVAVAGALLPAVACNSVDLSKSLSVTPVMSGYYDDGLLDGWSHLLPNLTFKLKNTGTVPISAGVKVTVSFWFKGDTDGENDSIVLPGLETTLAPGEESIAITARAPHGFRLEGARADFFQHSMFKDMTAKVFVQRRGTIYPLGEFPIDRLIIPHASATPGHP
jgi:hypothetical protein